MAAQVQPVAMLAVQPVAAQVQAVAMLPTPAGLGAIQPLNLLAQQVNFHVGFLVDFVVTGAQLFALEAAIPGTLAQDIQNGTPVPVALGRALLTFGGIELEAGQQLVAFGAEYVTFQLQFLTNLLLTTVGSTATAFATFAVGAVGQLVPSVAAGLAPASGAQALSTSPAPAAVVTTPRVTDIVRSRQSGGTAVGNSDDPAGVALRTRHPEEGGAKVRDRGIATLPSEVSAKTSSLSDDGGRAGSVGHRRDGDANPKADGGAHGIKHAKTGG